jgi:PhnB protein
MPINQLLIPHLTVKNAAAAIDFYAKTLGFKEMHRLLTPDGKILHAVLLMGEQMLMLNDSFAKPADGKASDAVDEPRVTLHLNVSDIDAAFAEAIAAGAKSTMPPADMFWGDRYGKFIDPFGQHWSMSTNQEKVPAEEIKKRMEAQFGKKK